MKVVLPRIAPADIFKQHGQSTARTIQNDYDNWKLTTDFLEVAGVKTALHTSPNTHTGPTLLFVHGIGGDYHGMVPLAYLLRDSYNVLFVDLPGHGKSATPPRDSLAFLEEWSKQLTEALEDRVDMVIAHSFGCYGAQFMGAPMTCYVNPPLSLSPAVLEYSLKLYTVRYLASLIYNVRPYALWRGQQLVQHLDDIVKARIAWVTDSSKISRSQFLFQARQARQTTDGRQLLKRELIDRVGSTFVVSRFDQIATVAPEQYSWIEALPVLQLPDDHLSILESPEAIADVIKDQLALHHL
jgi:pimeloyl-ACP methyl ester carboxylesterase